MSEICEHEQEFKCWALYVWCNSCACTHMRLCACMYVYKDMHIYIYIYTYMHIRIYIYSTWVCLCETYLSLSEAWRLHARLLPNCHAGRLRPRYTSRPGGLYCLQAAQLPAVRAKLNEVSRFFEFSSFKPALQLDSIMPRNWN